MICCSPAAQQHWPDAAQPTAEPHVGKADAHTIWATLTLATLWAPSTRALPSLPASQDQLQPSQTAATGLMEPSPQHNHFDLVGAQHWSSAIAVQACFTTPAAAQLHRRTHKITSVSAALM